MSDYRDERRALQQRNEMLETQLRISGERVVELEEENAALRHELEAKGERLEELEAIVARRPGGAPPKKKRATLVVGGALIAAVVAAGAGYLMMASAPSPVVVSQVADQAPVPAPRPEGPAPTPRPTRPAHALTAAPTCTCGGKVLGSFVGASMSMGGNRTLSVSMGLLPEGTAELPLDEATLLQLDIETAPAPKVEGSLLELGMLCPETLSDRVVFAHDEHVTAWSLADGAALWSARLPEPYDGRKSNRDPQLLVQCKPLPVEGGLVAVPIGGGRSVRVDPSSGAVR